MVCWLWRAHERYRTQFKAEHVNALKRMVRRHLHIPHEFVCITNMPKGIDKDVRIVDLWKGPNVPGMAPHRPNCYVRLRAYAPEMREIIGPRFISLDLDAVICNDITPLLTRPEEFVSWGRTAARTHYNGSMWMMTAGARRQVWEQFDPRTTPVETRKARMTGSDQAAVSYILGPGEALWTEEDGVYSYRNHFANAHQSKWPKPEDLRIVFFHGHKKPWDRDVQARHAWVRQNYG